MIATINPPEQRIVLHNVTWETFETLLRETGEHRLTQFVYDRGTLEIMTPLYEHESPKIQLDRFIVILAEELGREIKSAGSMTLKREDLQRGIEPDNCYYIQNELTVRGLAELDLKNNPPPDLAIEIDITSSSVDKLGIYAALGVAEIWRYNGQVLQFWQLQAEGYVESEFSLAFPVVSVSQMQGFLDLSKSSGEIALVKSFRNWIRQKI